MILRCILSRKHRGRVDYTDRTGAYWMCDNCGQVVR